MRYNPLGKTGVLVSELCLGTMTFGEGWGFGGIDDHQADAIVGRALESGINFIDTADVYSDGNSESILGRALGGGRRDRVVLATKALGRMGRGPNDAGLSRGYLIRACEASLRRLGTDRIDLYQIHGWDALTPIEETLAALDHLVRSGKVVSVGYCNLAAWQAALALGISAREGFASFVSAQMYYSLVGRDVEHEVVPLCRHAGLSLLPWSPLAGGFLTGKYRKEQQAHPQGSRFSTSKFGEFPPVDKAKGFEVVEALIALAYELETTPTTLAIRWLLSRPAVTSVIIGVRRLEQMQANLDATTVSIPEDKLAAIDALTAPAKLYPGWMIERQAGHRVIPK
ncbi:MAG: aldo/keto reductase [Isosphaeraceae bacterium]|nr:aldo/keto reductase [Isosphaeraceae bacterium]